MNPALARGGLAVVLEEVLSREERDQAPSQSSALFASVCIMSACELVIDRSVANVGCLARWCEA